MLSIAFTRRWVRLATAFLLAAALAIPLFSAAAPARAAGSLPCDIYASGGTPCEAAYSTTRALFASYNGPLYQVQRASDGSHLNIGLQSGGGVVNAAPQVSFCSGTTCTITELYDQTPTATTCPSRRERPAQGARAGSLAPARAGRTSAPRPWHCR